MTAVAVDTPGLTETLKAFQGLEADLRKQANAELRSAARECASELASRLRVSAASSPTPQASLVAKSIKVKSDRIPAVSIGGSRRVGRYGAPAGALVWGSEHGGKNFAASEGGAYWISPAVDSFANAGALSIYRRAVFEILKKWRLV